jgi:telomere length regulation protein
LIEEFFRHQYSTDQRFSLLNSLVFGARELAGIPTPSTTAIDSKRIAFPTKQLPPALHKKYVTTADQARTVNAVEHLLEDVTRNAIAKTKDEAEAKVPAIARERRLRLKQPTKITEVTRASDLSSALQSAQLLPKPVVAFTEVAAEHFVCPLINRFWLFLRDEQTRESRTAHQPNLHQYRAGGTGLILSALVLSQFVRSLALLVHMARNAPEFLAIIAPDALELAVTVGTRPLSQAVEQNDDDVEADDTNRKDKEAAVLTSALELAIVSIDGCLDLDDGRSLGLEHTTLLLAAGEWAEEILGYLEKGERALGGGGEEEIRLRRAAAGLALKVDELRTKWRRSMVEL